MTLPTVKEHKERCFDCRYSNNRYAQNPCKALKQLELLIKEQKSVKMPVEPTVCSHRWHKVGHDGTSICGECGQSVTA